MSMDIEQTHLVPFPLARVYDAWVSSSTVIPPATAMDIKPEVGGHYRLLMDTPEGTLKNEGRFLLVEPNRRVRYTWEWNGDGEVSEIDVSFASRGDGTEVTIRHTGFTKPESVDAHTAGWHSYIEGFVDYLSSI